MVDAHGVRTTVRLEAELTLRVFDAVDFCPGAGQGAATFARPLLFGLQVDLDPLAVDVGALYGGNDRDEDGRPDTQPYAGADFALDPCPETAAPRCLRR